MVYYLGTMSNGPESNHNDSSPNIKKIVLEEEIKVNDVHEYTSSTSEGNVKQTGTSGMPKLSMAINKVKRALGVSVSASSTDDESVLHELLEKTKESS